MSRRRTDTSRKGKKRAGQPSRWVPLALFGWALAVHLVYLAGDVLFAGPVSAFFFADGVHFLESARHLGAGSTTSAGLPFHPPLVTWLLLPLWQLFDAPETVYMASKTLMAALNAATVVAVYLLARRGGVPHAGLLCALLPLSFGELLLSSVVNAEAVYRLLLAGLLLLGARAPALAGGLHAAAALTRAEHLAVAGLLLLWGLVSPARRRAAAIAGGVGLLCLLPHVVATSADLRAYNQRHAGQLPEPLPTVVPVSFYGPLNFALAHTEEGIFFSRRTLPVTRGEAAALDPTDPRHNAVIVDGYRIGLEAIAAAPVRFVRRSLEKAAFSLHGLTWGWTWRDWPKGREWTRPPVDMAYAGAPLYQALALALIALGLFALRDRPAVLALGLALIAYRLAINVAFFPYLRSMAIAAPFAVLALGSGIAWLARSRAPAVLSLLLIALGGYHLATGWQDRRVLIAGERDAAGTIIDDRTVRLKLAEER